LQNPFFTGYSRQIEGNPCFLDRIHDGESRFSVEESYGLSSSRSEEFIKTPKRRREAKPPFEF
jgi:hypothetical protein